MKKSRYIIAIVVAMFAVGAMLFVACEKNESQYVEASKKESGKTIATWSKQNGLEYTVDIEQKIKQNDALLKDLFPESCVVMEDYAILDSFPTMQTYTATLKIAIFNVSDSVGYNIYWAIDKKVDNAGNVMYLANTDNGGINPHGICENRHCRHACMMDIKRDSHGRITEYGCQLCEDTWNVVYSQSSKCRWVPEIQVSNSAVGLIELIKILL